MEQSQLQKYYTTEYTAWKRCRAFLQLSRNDKGNYLLQEGLQSSVAEGPEEAFLCLLSLFLPVTKRQQNYC